jgi:excisionase family DNA binding protein
MGANTISENTKTLSVPQAGRRYFDLGRGASYAAAARGEIPVIRIGRKIRVPVAALDRMLERAGEGGAASHR